MRLKTIYDDVIEVHASLTMKLAHHNGIKQFGLDFRSRVPPIEFRVLLPWLEASIGRELQKLSELLEKLEAIQFQSEDLVQHEPIQHVHSNALEWMRSLHARTHATFLDQHRQIREIALELPQFSLVLHAFKSSGTKFSEKMVSSIGSPLMATVGDSTLHKLSSCAMSSCSPLGMESVMTDCPSDLSVEAHISMEVDSDDSDGECSETCPDAFASVFEFSGL
jgi:hypothetical protein